MPPKKNPTEPFVDLDLGGEVIYELFFDFEAVAEAEDRTGESLILGLNARTVNAPRVSFVRALFFACLKPRQPEITFQQAAALVTHKNIQIVWGKVLEAWTSCMKEIKEDQAAAGDPPVSQG
jgi:hypothetical protein